MEKGLEVSGGEKGFCSRYSMGGDAGVWGNGFSQLRLELAACLIFRGDTRESLLAVDTDIGDVVARPPVCIFVGLCLPPDVDPNLGMLFRMLARKSTGSSTSSSLFENLDTSSRLAGGAGLEVSLSDMTDHTDSGLEGLQQLIVS